MPEQLSSLRSHLRVNPAAALPQLPDADVLIIGAGLAGLYTALKLAPMKVVLLSPRPLGAGAASAWAQAGIAAAIGKGDSPEAHAADTIRVGGGLVDEAMARLIVGEAPFRIADLLRLGVPFDRELEGGLALAREAAHSTRRIVHVKGDQAGKAIMTALTRAVQAAPSVRVIENWLADGLIRDGKRVVGVHARPSGKPGQDPQILMARAVVLATGGIGALYAHTTNPLEARGDGLAIAARAGAVIADAEFVQFHPTAIDIGHDPMPLASEALRGEGALLVNSQGERFMAAVHPDGELAPRDIVARAVHRERVSGRGAFLDCRALGARLAHEFLSVYGACVKAGLDPEQAPIPIAPAAHYHMGGVLTDACGRTTLDHLWACGEVASTGMHGANRLASNSLLEALVMGGRIAEDIAGYAPGWYGLAPLTPPPAPAPPLATEITPQAQQDIMALREAMSAHVGVERCAAGLSGVLLLIDEIERREAGNATLSRMLDAARLITIAAISRTESRGSHYRSDFPETEAVARHSYLTVDTARALTAMAPAEREAAAPEALEARG